MTTIASHCLQCDFTNSNHYKHCPKCGLPLVLLAEKYQLEQLLSQGGMGQLYLAQHLHLQGHSERVIKIIHPKFFGNTQALQRFQREIQVTALLSHSNEHIVRIYDDFGEEEGLGHYYVMEYLQGQSLSEFMSGSYGMPLELAFHLFTQMTKALTHAHQNEIVHRDLKPDNIVLIERDDDPLFVKIVDFGIARLYSSEGPATLTHDIVGTPAYMSPEQCTNAPVDGRSDIYSLGLILYEMLAGQSPYLAQSSSATSKSPIQWLHTHTNSQPIPLTTKRPDLHRLSPVLAKALAKSPEQRFQTMEAFWEAVSSCTKEDSSIVATTASSPWTPKLNASEPHSMSGSEDAAPQLTQFSPSNRIRTWLTTLGVTLSLLVVIGFLLPRNQEKQPKKSSTPVLPLGSSAQTLSTSKRDNKSTLAQKGSVPTKKKTSPHVTSSKKLRRQTTFHAPTRRVHVRKRTIPSHRKRPKKQSLPTLRKKKKRRAPQPRQATKQGKTPRHKHPICGPSTLQWRWVFAKLAKPKKRSARISFVTCKKCRSFPSSGGFCLRVPRKTLPEIEISVEGHQSCIHKIPLHRTSLSWRLKIEQAMELADSAYPCFQ